MTADVVDTVDGLQAETQRGDLLLEALMNKFEMDNVFERS